MTADRTPGAATPIASPRAPRTERMASQASACQRVVGPAEITAQRGHGPGGQAWIEETPADQLLQQRRSACRLDRDPPAFRPAAAGKRWLRVERDRGRRSVK